jgi:hypothetical protein
MKIAIGFRGTLVPKDITKDIGSAYVLKRLVREGHFLGLDYGMSEEEKLEAVNWFLRNEIELTYVQPEQNIPNYIINVRGISTPYIEQAVNFVQDIFVDWKTLELFLEKENILRKGYSI